MVSARDLAWTLVAIGLLAAGPAWADEAGASGKVEYERGLRYFQAGEHAAALPHFQRAYLLSARRPSAILGLAQCERALKRFPEALIHLREYLETSPPPTEAEATVVRATIALIEDLRREPAAAELGSGGLADEPTAGSSTLAASAPSNPALIQPPQEGSGILSSPVFWIVTVVGAAGAVITLGLALSQDADPNRGNTGVFLTGP